MRCIGNRCGVTQWKNPYVTDGLIAMWDGEWNVGPGKHDPTAIVWKDLSVNGHDLTFPGAGNSPFAQWGNNCATRYTTFRFVSNIAEGSVVAPQISVIEIVFKRSYYSNYSYPKTIFQGLQGCGIRILENASDQNDCIIFGGYATNKGVQIGNLIGIVSCVAIMSGSGNSTIVSDYYINGIRVNDGDLVTVSTNWNALSPYQITIGGRRVVDNDHAFSGSIYRVGCYSSLTANQISNNYSIDKTRFNLP